MSEPRVILMNDSARTFPSAGFVAIRESKTYIEKILSNTPKDNGRDYEAIMAIRHEMIHFLHSFTTAYLYNHAVEMVRYAFNILDHFPEFLASKNQKTPLESVIDKLELREYGISVRDILEGVAVVESYKMNTPNPNVEDFLKKRDHYFSGREDSYYCRSFDYLSEKVSQEFAYHLLAPLSFLSLQFDNPPKYFQIIVEDNLPGLSLEKLIRASVPELYECFGMDINKHILFALDDLPPNMKHPVLLECAVYAASSCGVWNLLEFAARPSLIELSRIKPEPECLDGLMPPLLVTSSSPGSKLQALYFGVARNDREMSALMIRLQGLIGAAERLTKWKDKSLPTPQFCPQQGNCPHHKSALCFEYFAPPSIELGYKNCGFIRDFESRTKIKPNEAWCMIKDDC